MKKKFLFFQKKLKRILNICDGKQFLSNKMKFISENPNKLTLYQTKQNIDKKRATSIKNLKKNKNPKPRKAKKYRIFVPPAGKEGTGSNSSHTKSSVLPPEPMPVLSTPMPVLLL